ncbi:MAG TPA: methyltransferase domain-containing protein [Solirubrobacteraceae bacterium]|nr:methyltransferase domain-containing protein [Solirubrobacteraceae bacterium]
MSTDLAAFKDNQRRLWSAGDYSVTARRLEDVARDLVSACRLAPGMRALDVGAGTGNVALAIAASGASPEACDLTPALVTAGKERCDALGEWEIPWEVADAEQLPYATGRFDAALSVFGLVFAPRPEVAIAEAFRVTRSGGCVGFTTWTPDSASERFGRVAGKYFPASDDPPPSPHLWGDEEVCRARLKRHAIDVQFELSSVTWRWSSAAAAREEAEESNNFVAAARDALSQERYMALLDDLDELMHAMNTATDGGLAYEAQYARVVARKAG